MASFSGLCRQLSEGHRPAGARMARHDRADRGGGRRRRRQAKLVAHFMDRRKTLPLNKGHIAVLQQAFGDNPDNCRGANIILFPEATRTPQGLPAIGVRIKLPQIQAPPQQPLSRRMPTRSRRTHASVRAAGRPASLLRRPLIADAMDDEIPF